MDQRWSTPSAHGGTSTHMAARTQAFSGAQQLLGNTLRREASTTNRRPGVKALAASPMHTQVAPQASSEGEGGRPVPSL
jgi:hypothetical protein